jgi:hypothetical protein
VDEPFHGHGSQSALALRIANFCYTVQRSRPDRSPNDFGRPVAFGAVTEDGEIVVEGGDPLEAEALDDDEAVRSTIEKS